MPDRIGNKTKTSWEKDVEAMMKTEVGKLRYPTAEERRLKQLTSDGKVRECAITACPPTVKEKCACIQYDRPIICAKKRKDDKGVTRCITFRPADVQILQSFEDTDSNEHRFAWHRDIRKYVIMRNNKIVRKYSMDALAWAYQYYWELIDGLSLKKPRKRK